MNKIIISFFGLIAFICKPYAAVIINKEDPVYYFVNHEEQIHKLRQKLLTDRIVGITGIAGIGKSEMARKYVQEYKQDYEIIAFLDASIDLTGQLISIAKEINQQICLKSGCYIAEDHKNVKKSLFSYLKNKDKWLLILDNLHINENNKIMDITNSYYNGHIIVCSQDSQHLLSKISVPYLKDAHAVIIIKKIMQDPPLKFVQELVQNLRKYPTYMIGHSATFLQNNNHMTIQEYVKYIVRHDNKVKAHLNVILKHITPQSKDLLYNIALLNNQKVSRNLLEKLLGNNNDLSDAINEIVRFGLVEQVSMDRDKQIFRMHDVIKEALLEIRNPVTNKANIDNLLTKLQALMSNEMVNQFYFIIQDSTFASNLEMLLSNADKYNSNIYKVMTLRSSLLGYYLRAREPYNAKKNVDWFKEKESRLCWYKMNVEEREMYCRYLGRIGRYEYFVVNRHPKIAMQYLLKAKKYIDELPDNYGAKTAIYFEVFQVQLFTGNIIDAENNLHIIERIMSNNTNLIHKMSMVDYGKARILLAQGKYQAALLAITDMISKEQAQLDKSKVLVRLSNSVVKQENAWLAPIYMLQVEILNYMHRFTEAYNMANEVYTKIKNNTSGEITSTTLAYCLTELSRAEVGLGKKEEALSHATEAINILVEDESRNNNLKDLDNSIDIFLVSALVAKADVLSSLGQVEEAMDVYTLTKNIYWNIYGIQNIGNVDNVGYAFVQAAKTAIKLPDKQEGHIQCSYFYSLLSSHFGDNHPRTKQVQGICSKY